MKIIPTLTTLAALTAALHGAPANAWTYCASNHRSGFVEFDPSAGSAHLVMDGSYIWHGGRAVDVWLRCGEDLASNRPAWTCTEAPPYAHPDGRLSLGIEVSYEYYLMVATRDSAEYRAPIVADDLTCYR